MIRSAKISEITDILTMTKACTAAMIAKGIYQWTSEYPSREAFELDVERKELFVLEINKKIRGCIVISRHIDEEYKSVNWLTPSINNCYIHRLGVHPDFQGKGFAQEMMQFAEKRAKELGYASIRLDTFSQNKRNQHFYETRGYQRLGDIFFPNQSEHPFHCYELVL